MVTKSGLTAQRGDMIASWIPTGAEDDVCGGWVMMKKKKKKKSRKVQSRELLCPAMEAKRRKEIAKSLEPQKKVERV